MRMAVGRVRRANQPPELTDTGSTSITSDAAAMNSTLAIVFALYVKTRNFQWHVGDTAVQDCHLMLEEQGDQLYSMIEPIVARVRALGISVFGSIGRLNHRRMVLEGEADRVQALNMLAELREDNKALIASLRQASAAYRLRGDASVAGLLDTWIDEARQRTQDLHESYRDRAAAAS